MIEFKGSYFPAFLEPRKTAERALVAMAGGLDSRRFNAQGR